MPFPTNDASRIPNSLTLTKNNLQIVVPEVVGGRYKIKEVLSASTGFGLVLIASDTKLYDRRVLIKTVNYKGSIRKNALDLADIVKQKRKNIEYEYHILRSINALNVPGVPVMRDFIKDYNPSIHQALGASIDEELLFGEPYLVLQYVPGVPLNEYIERLRIDRSSAKWQMKTLLLVKQIVKTFERLHNLRSSVGNVLKFIYQDLKSSNVIISAEGNFTLIDFGGVATVTKDGIVLNAGIGTPGYMPPEIHNQDYQPNETTDVYTIGVLMYEMLTGINPSSIVNEKGIAKLDYSKLNCAQHIKSIIMKCTAFDKTHRYSSVDQLKKDIVEALKKIGRDKSGEANGDEESRDIFKSEEQTIDQNIFEKLFDSSDVSPLEISIYVNKKEVMRKSFKYDEVVIGRNSSTTEVDLDLSDIDPEHNISRRAVEIIRQEAKYYVRDVSRNPLFLNGKKMEKDVLYELQPNIDHFLVIVAAQDKYIGLRIRVNE
uniref:non-specific serine/threonine protein kinase n=1 Tax=Pseudothermotoga hypogea TaxID=57487 RepID=A0A832MMQ2_9THEM